MATNYLTRAYRIAREIRSEHDQAETLRHFAALGSATQNERLAIDSARAARNKFRS